MRRIFQGVNEEFHCLGDKSESLTETVGRTGPLLPSTGWGASAGRGGRPRGLEVVSSSPHSSLGKEERDAIRETKGPLPGSFS